MPQWRRISSLNDRGHAEFIVAAAGGRRPDGGLIIVDQRSRGGGPAVCSVLIARYERATIGSRAGGGASYAGCRGSGDVGRWRAGDGR
jgi:hypothetical protein